MLPNFAIIGAQKSASTFLHLCLAEHPDVFIPPKEINYFEDPDYEQTNKKDFEALFSKALNMKAIGIKRPTYLTYPKCAQRIQELIPEVKFVVILRNPVERAISAYYHYIRYGFFPALNPNKGLLDLISRKYEKTYPRSKEIIEFGYYYKYLSKFFSLFKSQQFLILFYEDIKNDKLKQIQTVYRFLGIDDSYVPHGINSKPQEGIYSIPRLKFLRLCNYHLYTYSSKKTRLDFKRQNLVDKFIYKFVKFIDRFFMCHLFSSSMPILEIPLKRKLFSVYFQDIINLEKLLNTDLTNWKSNLN